VTAEPLTLVPDAALEHPAVCLLGPLEFADGSSPTSSMVCQTLALLAAQPGKIWTASALIDELWAERKLINRPKQSVETYIHLLRRDWGHWLHIEHRQGGYCLVADPAAVDAHRFVALAEQARHEADEGHLLRATDTLRAAFSLWRGPVFCGVEPTPWLTRWATGIEDRRRTARQLGFDIALKLGHHRDVLDDLREELRADWSREDIAETLMVALYRSQRRAEALNIYRTVREALAEEHGLDPCPRLQRLQQQILSGDPALELEER